MKYILVLFAIEILLFIYNRSISIKLSNKILILEMILVFCFGMAVVVFNELHNLITIYEICLIIELLAIILQFLFEIIQKKHIKMLSLKAISLSSVSVAIYTIFTYGQAHIDSDFATATLLSKCMLDNCSLFPKLWNYANGEIWLIRNELFCLLPTLLLSNQSLARMIGSAFFVCIAIVGIIFHSKKIYQDDTWVISVPIITTFLFASANVFMYQAAYTGEVLWIVLMPLMLWYIYKPNEKRHRNIYIAIWFVLMTLLTVDGVRELAELTAPMVLQIALLFYLSFRSGKISKAKLKKFIYMELLIIVPSMIGFSLNKWLCSWHNVNNTVHNSAVFPETLSDVGNNIIVSINNIFGCFGYTGGVNLFSLLGIRNIISISTCILFCFVVPLLQIIKLNKETDSFKFYFTYAVLHNMVLVLTAVLCGKIEKRYLYTTVVCSVILSSRYVFKMWIDNKSFDAGVLVIAFIATTTIETIVLGMNSIGWTKTLTIKKEFNDDLISRGLDKGYAYYWNAYNNEVYSDLTIEYGAVIVSESEVRPRLWLDDSEKFLKEKNHETFLLLSEEENQLISSNIESIFGKPKEEFVLQDKYIYVFDYDIASNFNNGLLDGVLEPYELNVTENVEATRDELILHQGSKQYGPYISMKEGTYYVCFKGENMLDADCDIYSNTDRKNIVYEEIKRTDEEITLKLILKKDSDRMEFRLMNNVADSEVVLYEIDVTQE